MFYACTLLAFSWRNDVLPGLSLNLNNQFFNTTIFPWTQNVNYTYIKRSEEVWTSYVPLIYVLCLGGIKQRVCKMYIYHKGNGFHGYHVFWTVSQKLMTITHEKTETFIKII